MVLQTANTGDLAAVNVCATLTKKAKKGLVAPQPASKWHHEEQ